MWNSDSCKGVQVWGRTGPNHTHYPADWSRVKGKNLQQVPVKLRFVCIQTVAATGGQTGSGKSQQLQWFAIINSDFKDPPTPAMKSLPSKLPLPLFVPLLGCHLSAWSCASIWKQRAHSWLSDMQNSFCTTPLGVRGVRGRVSYMF